MEEASFFNEGKDFVSCQLCKHNCVIKNGEKGFCGVRENTNQKLYSLNYGKISSFGIDPIEKKPLYHFLPFTNIFSVGSFGCNFKCSFCQNWNISQILRKTKTISPEDLISEVKTPSIAFTYNEPTVFYEYVRDVSFLAKERGIKRVWVTNGYIENEPLMKIKHLISAVNIDFKAYSKEFYARNCKASFEKYLESLKIWAKTKIWTEFTNLIIPNQNDSEDEIKDMCGFIKEKFGDHTPLHFSAYYPAHQMNLPPTKVESLEKAYTIAKDVGLKYVYIGNVNTSKLNTFCYNCNEILINRQNQDMNLGVDNKCPSCGKKQFFYETSIHSKKHKPI